ncbi:MAG: hypothetical protein EXR76_10305, partial [Myxococcales bacterium]|nr:hypothetical protein [Myxococcales bacterium]
MQGTIVSITQFASVLKVSLIAESRPGILRGDPDALGVAGRHGVHLLDAMLWAICPSHVPARMDVTLAIASYWELRFADGRRARMDSRDQLQEIGDEEVRGWCLALH